MGTTMEHIDSLYTLIQSAMNELLTTPDEREKLETLQATLAAN